MSEPTPAPANTPQVQLLTQRYADHIVGTLGCWDRVIITGTLTDVCHAGALEGWLRRDNIRCFDPKVFAEPLRDAVRDHAILAARAAMKTDLRLTDTNAASDSKGRTWRLEGGLFWWLVGGIGVGITLFFVLLVPLNQSFLTSFVVALIPVALCLAHIFGLRQGKPPSSLLRYYSLACLNRLFAQGV